MVALTAASQLGASPAVPSGSHTVDDTYLGTAPTHVVNPFTADALVAAATWSGNRTLTAAAGEAAATVGAAEHDLEETYVGTPPTQVVNGLDPESSAPATWSGNLTRPAANGQTDAAQATTEHDLGTTYHGNAPTQVVTGWDEVYGYIEGAGEYQANRAAEGGTLIPTKYFRRVTGTVLDEEGNPIEGALYLAALGGFPTLGNVNRETGAYSIYLLRQNYSDLVLLQKAPNGKPYDFVRYELAENPDLSIQVRTADLYFDTTLPKPVQAGSGMKFGGMMQT